MTFQSRSVLSKTTIKDHEVSIFLLLQLYTDEKLNKIFVVKMSDFVFTLINLASVTFFPASPLIRTPVNTDTINRVPLYCLCLG